MIQFLFSIFNMKKLFSIVSPPTFHLAPRSLNNRDLSPIKFLLFSNNTTSWSIFYVPGIPQLSALHSEVPTRPGNHLQQLDICTFIYSK